MSQTVEDLVRLAKTKGFFICGICEQSYSKVYYAPITLHCGHTFCRRCIDQLGKIAVTHVPCGLCQIKTWTPSKKLTKNYQILDMLERYRLLHDDPIDDATKETQPFEAQNAGEEELGETPPQADESAVDGNTTELSSSNTDESTNTIETGGTTFTGMDQGNRTVVIERNIQLNEETEQILATISDSTGLIRGGLEELCDAIRNVADNQIAQIQRTIGSLFNEVDEVAYHPVVSMLRELTRIRADPIEARLQDIARHVEENYAFPPPIVNGTNENGAIEAEPNTLNIDSMEGEQVRRLIEQHRAEIPADLAAEMTRYYVNQNANSDNFSIIANSDISTTRDFSSTNGSEADQREVVDALESDIERLDWPLD